MTQPAKSTNEILVCLLNELAAHTDAEHGLSVRELSRRVGATDKTVRAHLRLLEMQQPLGRAVRHLTAEDITHADSDDATPGWYMEPAIDVAQLRLLGDALVLSHIDAEYAHEAYERLRALAGYAGSHSDGLNHLRIPRPYNREFLSTVENLDEAISKARVVTFHMCSYAADGTLVEKTDSGTSQPRGYRADPYQMTYRNGMYYLLCHMHGHDGMAFLHVDRIRHLQVLGEDVPQECTLQSLRTANGTTLPLADYLAERVYPWSGPAEDILIRVTSLFCVYEWFERPSVTDNNDGSYTVRIHAEPKGVLWWALQFADADIIEILKPQSLRDELAHVGRMITDRYQSATH